MLKRVVESYLATRRAVGFDLRLWGRQLYDFARYSARRRQPFIRARTAVAWAARSASEHAREARLRKVALLAAFAHAADPRHELVPIRVFVNYTNRRPTPFIFSREDLGRLLLAASHLKPNPHLRPHTYVALLSLLSATGLRLSEALGLRVADITADGLLIRRTKFRKSRVVPIHPSVRRGLAAYLQRRRHGATDRIFVFDDGRPLSASIVEYTVHRLLKSIGLEFRPGKPHPCIHSLRHTFAVRALEGAPTDKRLIEHHLLALSTYLGHVHHSSTYWYLEKTPLILAQVARVSESSFWRGAS